MCTLPCVNFEAFINKPPKFTHNPTKATLNRDILTKPRKFRYGLYRSSVCALNLCIASIVISSFSFFLQQQQPQSDIVFRDNARNPILHAAPISISEAFGLIGEHS